MSNLNEKLAALKGNYLERDDESDPGGRIYRDKVSGEILPFSHKNPWRHRPRRTTKSPSQMGWSALTQPKLATWPQLAAPQPIHQPNMFSRPLNASPEQQLKNATAGAYQKMAFIEHQKQSQNGPSKKAIQGAPRVPWSGLAAFARGSAGMDPGPRNKRAFIASNFQCLPPSRIRWSV